MNRTTRAQRLNAKYDKIWEQAKNTQTRFTAEGRELSDYAEYCEAKREIDEEPLTIDQWRDFAESSKESTQNV